MVKEHGQHYPKSITSPLPHRRRYPCLRLREWHWEISAIVSRKNLRYSASEYVRGHDGLEAVSLRRIADYELNQRTMNNTLKTVLGYSLAASLAIAPAAALAKDRSGLDVREDARAKVEAKAFKAEAKAEAKTSVKATTTDSKRGKAYGHFIAPGWLKRNGTTTVDANIKLPFGIAWLLGLSERPSKDKATTTPDTKAPRIAVLATRTGTSTAMVKWFTNERSTSQIAYGTTTAYGSVTTLDGNLTLFHSATIAGLAPNTTYHFQVMSKDASGNLATSPDKTFTTKPLADTTAPVISSVAASVIGSTTASVTWATNEPATSKVYFDSGASLDLDDASIVQNAALVTNHSLPLSGLTSSTTYSFAVQSKDATGNKSTSAIGSFVTGL